MDKVEINIQNEAKNMIIGSKQHTLFKCVASINPALLSTTSAVPEYGEAEPAGETGLTIQAVSIACPECPKTEQQKAPDVAAGADQNTQGSSGHNSQLYGPLKPCSKQFMVKS